MEGNNATVALATKEIPQGFLATNNTYDNKPLYKGGEEYFNHDHKVNMNGEKSIIVRIGKITSQIILKNAADVKTYAQRILTHHLGDTMKFKVLDGMPIVKTKAMAVGLNTIKGITLPKVGIQWASSMDFQSAKKDYVTEENIAKVANQINQLFTIKTIAKPKMTCFNEPEAGTVPADALTEE